MTNAVFKIGDFSQLAQVTVRTLRLYDELGLLRPAEIDKFTGYRYYTLEQLPRLNRILALKDLGLSLEEIAQLLKDQLPAEQLRAMLKRKREAMARELQERESQLRRVEARLDQIEREDRVAAYDVVLKSAEPVWIASVRGNVPKVEMMPEVRSARLQTLYAGLAEAGVTPREPELFIYHNTEYTDTDIDMEAATVIEKAEARRLIPEGPIIARELSAAAQMASVIHRGPLREVPQAIIALFTWIGANGFTSAGDIREYHLRWRELELADEEFHTVTLEMQIPVAQLETIRADS
jgi:DNA-binding transcriptional MerR regulator